MWDVADPAGRAALYALFALGWLTVLVTTFLINHFDLFGLRQVWLFLRGRPYTPLPLHDPGPVPPRPASRCTSAGSSRSGRRRR